MPQPDFEQEVTHLEGRIVFETVGEGEKEKRMPVLEADGGERWTLLGHLGGLRDDCRVRMSGAVVQNGFFIYAYKLLLEGD